MRRNALLIAVLFLGLSCRDPRAEANIAQAMMDVGTQLSQIQQDIGEMHNTVDSLRTVVAKQDTIISRLANLAGVPIPSR